MFDMCRINRKTMQPVENDHPLSGSNYLAYARELKKIALENGIVCNFCAADTPDDAKALFELGVDCILTNDFHYVKSGL